MNLLILSGPASPSPALSAAYRGTYRAVPSHCGEVPDQSEINELFLWYLNEGGEEGVVHDRVKAVRFATLWNERLARDQLFEVVEVTDDNEPPQGAVVLLGFDISSGLAGYSLLAEGLSVRAAPGTMPVAIWELWNLLARSYGPKLNANGLFPTNDDAAMCLRSMTALQSLCPDLYEGGDLHEFRPIGVHLLHGDSGEYRTLWGPAK